MADISVEELYSRRQNGEEIFILDVREHFEYDLVNIGGELIPLGELENRLYEIEAYKDKEVIVYCRTGSRSAYAVQVLAEHGFQNPRNLTGGIHEWSRKIDPSVPMY